MPPITRRQSGSSSANLFRIFLFTIVGVLVVLITASLFITYGGEKGGEHVGEKHHGGIVRLMPKGFETPKPTEDLSVAQELVGNPSMTKPKIAYAITVTKDGSFLDGALVLGYAARKYHDASKGFPSAYDVDLVAFVAPPVVSSIPTLEKFGWKVLRRELPVRIDEIQNQDYAQKMKNSGCCGADEFLKLWAYTLTDYHRVIHLDMDSIIFKNMDQIFNIDKEFLFTGDYNMKGNCKYPPVQGGFLVVQPSMQTFEDFKEIIRRGNHGAKGWEGSHIGNFWGGQTIQGIMPYYYNIVHPERALELNRCEYNCMVDNPYRPNTLICQDGQKTCQDCRLQTPEKVYSAHFTICQKPWTCTYHNNPRNMELCKVFHAKWFQLRDEFEKELGLDTSYRAVNTPFKESLGMCKSYGDSKYMPIPVVV
uniref:Uncharacterized protein n=1 Tax=Spumella elongata TaxID=89044 RepID=A0A7S3HGE2_9STRA|mmetsp:Transcript_51083/g.89138  ORF Transcript_51083/g.89138 Transcript_51083/m.89138 type:complete len:422 (+) Transcript_51083:48-1313(+)